MGLAETPERDRVAAEIRFERRDKRRGACLIALPEESGSSVSGLFPLYFSSLPRPFPIGAGSARLRSGSTPRFPIRRGCSGLAFLRIPHRVGRAFASLSSAGRTPRGTAQQQPKMTDFRSNRSVGVVFADFFLSLRSNAGGMGHGLGAALRTAEGNTLKFLTL